MFERLDCDLFYVTMNNIIKKLNETSSSRSLRIDSTAYNLDNYSCNLDRSSYTVDSLAASFS